MKNEFQISIRIAVLYINSNSFFVILYPLEVYSSFPLMFSTLVVGDGGGGRRCLDGGGRGGESFGGESWKWKFVGFVK